MNPSAAWPVEEASQIGDARRAAIDLAERLAFPGVAGRPGGARRLGARHQSCPAREARRDPAPADPARRRRRGTGGRRDPRHRRRPRHAGRGAVAARRTLHGRHAGTGPWGDRAPVGFLPALHPAVRHGRARAHLGCAGAAGRAPAALCHRRRARVEGRRRRLRRRLGLAHAGRSPRHHRRRRPRAWTRGPRRVPGGDPDFHRSHEESPHACIQDVHAALRATRGAAVAAMAIDLERGVGRYSGVGNISSVVFLATGPARA